MHWSRLTFTVLDTPCPKYSLRCSFLSLPSFAGPGNQGRKQRSWRASSLAARATRLEVSRKFSTTSHPHMEILDSFEKEWGAGTFGPHTSWSDLKGSIFTLLPQVSMRLSISESKEGRDDNHRVTVYRLMLLYERRTLTMSICSYSITRQYVCWIYLKHRFLSLDRYLKRPSENLSKTCQMAYSLTKVTRLRRTPPINIL